MTFVFFPETHSRWKWLLALVCILQAIAVTMRFETRNEELSIMLFVLDVAFKDMLTVMTGAMIGFIVFGLVLLDENSTQNAHT